MLDTGLVKFYFETQNFEIFDKVVHNFGMSDKVIISWKNAYFQ